MIKVLIIGGRGNIGSGLRIYLPKLDHGYVITSVDLPGAIDLAAESGLKDKFVASHEALESHRLPQSTDPPHPFGGIHLRGALRRRGRCHFPEDGVP